MKYIYSGTLTLLLMGVMLVPGAQSVNAETTTPVVTSASVTTMLEQIKVLMAKVAELQKQLAAIRGEVQAALKDGLAQGMTDADIQKIQEILATDPTIYPEGMVTGYFGPLTEKALKRFQERHQLTVTGILDSETKDLLEEYLHEGFGDKIPPGLLRAPGIMKKVEARYADGCDGKGHGMGPLCKKLKAQYGDDENDDENEGFEVEVEIEDGTTKISFTFEGDDYDVEVDSVLQSDVLAAVADELDVTVADLDADLKSEIKDELEKAVADMDETDFNVVVETENGTATVSFTFEGDDYEVVVNSTMQSSVLTAVASKLDTTVYKLDSDLKDEIKSALEKALDDELDAAKTAAEDAIDDAQTEIDDAQDAIDAATGDTAAAEALLSDAQDKLDAAQAEFDDENYADAEDLADEAAGLAQDAVDALPA